MIQSITVQDICQCLNEAYPLAYQESWDNSGLLVGERNMPVSKALLSLDVNMDILNEAIAIGANLIIAHHPIIFGSLKQITDTNPTQQCIIHAIRNNIAIYCNHTPADKVPHGVSYQAALKLGLQNIRCLHPDSPPLKKLTVFIPPQAYDKCTQAIFDAGAGHIGNYDQCGYTLKGTGSFRPLDNANPYIGTKGTIEHVEELRFECIFEPYQEPAIIAALLKNHPYEEPAYDIYQLTNHNQYIGYGAIGSLPQAMTKEQLLQHILDTYQCNGLRYAGLNKSSYKTIALCGGSGREFYKAALSQNADLYITSDVKYHEFQSISQAIPIVDISHFHSEKFILHAFKASISKKYITFAAQISEQVTDPVLYY